MKWGVRRVNYGRGNLQGDTVEKLEKEPPISRVQMANIETYPLNIFRNCYKPTLNYLNR
jgi:hypothetical protein